ncbi:MAG TPA: ImmA/IrrE family metallo-endopeptidase [Allosphingosinicella sp.]|nr:ImmA/IrrE family metallo-endopeptidase [Allosphingosinicella sp.]
MTAATLRPIRSEADYAASLARIEDIIDALPGTAEADELEILATLVERYEEALFPIEAPTPLAAIRFRMEQQELTPRHLEPYIGSRARVSEVLSGTRPLSIDMIRALHQHLGIPAEVLLGTDDLEDRPPPELSKPATKVLTQLKLMKPAESLSAFLSRVCGESPALAMLRKTRTARTNAKTDLAALQAWCAGAMLRSHEIALTGQFDPARFNDQAIGALVRLSVEAHGPRLARERLASLGVPLVILPHLPGTHLDGAAMRRSDGVPIIALTLRRDRIDNFWFTLAHECVHISRHLGDAATVIFDDLEISSSEQIEQEADAAAAEALIPASLWASFPEGTFSSNADIAELARRAGVHPAIVAGRWQMRNRDFRKFSKLLGHGKVRPEFPDFAR